ncbi:MAG TPA: hypothetical protein PLD62_06170 [Candidatus Cloacimonadota bacterium]|nr:hypothetical protein [Candidatus Cloacimonadota bacterium]
MAELNLTFAEVINLLAANYLLPSQISQIETDENIISFRYQTGIAFPAHIDVSLQFLEYANGIVILNINTSWLIDKILRKIPLFQREFFELNGSRISIFLEKYLSRHFRGLCLDKMEFCHHRLEITFFTSS